MTTYLLPYTAGTVTTNGTTTVTGALTAWLANVKPGDRFRIGTSSGIVASVESNTSLTLEAAWSGSASGQSYAIDRWSRGWFSGGDLALALALYNTNRPTFIPTTGKPSDAVGSDGNVAFDASANIFYKKSSGAWDNGTSIVGLPGEITRSGAQTGGLAKFASDTEIGEATGDEIAAAGVTWNSVINLFQDSGRFAGSPEPTALQASAFAAPPYLSSYNGSTFSAGQKFIHNNTTYGGTLGVLGADVDALIQKIRYVSYRRYGVEFYLMNVAAGAGTAAPITVSGTTFYLAMLNATVPMAARTTIGINILVKTGSVAVSVNSNAFTFIDGALQGASFLIDSSDGWVQIVHRSTFDPTKFYNYDTNAYRIYATPGAEFVLGLPFLIPGWAPVSDVPYGIVPGLEAWR